MQGVVHRAVLEGAVAGVGGAIVGAAAPSARDPWPRSVRQWRSLWRETRQQELPARRRRRRRVLIPAHRTTPKLQVATPCYKLSTHTRARDEPCRPSGRLAGGQHLRQLFHWTAPLSDYMANALVGSLLDAQVGSGTSAAISPSSGSALHGSDGSGRLGVGIGANTWGIIS